MPMFADWFVLYDQSMPSCDSHAIFRNEEARDREDVTGAETLPVVQYSGQ